MLNGAHFGIWTFCIFPFLRKGKELFDAVIKIPSENLKALCAVWGILVQGFCKEKETFTWIKVWSDWIPTEQAELDFSFVKGCPVLQH